MSIDDLRSKLIDTPQKHLRAESELAGCSFNLMIKRYLKNFIQTSYS